VGGLEFLVDPGTFAYHTESDWRSYFRGTAAHNTVRIDGQDQSQQGGNFMWLRKARAGCATWSTNPGRDLFEGWQDGYAALADPVMHRRRIELDKRARRILVEDTLEMRGGHEVEIFFHCHEDCRVRDDGNAIVLSRGGKALTLLLPEGGEVLVMNDWVSRAFDRKQHAPTIAWRARLSGAQQLRTHIAC
jgi:hypothetical protein